MPRVPATRHVAVVAFPEVQILDVTGPLEVFGCAARLLAERSNAGAPAYRVEILASRAGALTCSSGMRIVASVGRVGCD